jgi:hypothetical protein
MIPHDALLGCWGISHAHGFPDRRRHDDDWRGRIGGRAVVLERRIDGDVRELHADQAVHDPGRIGSDYQSCTYQVHDHGASATSSNGKREHYYDCLRSDGTDGIYITTCSTTIKSNPVLEAC